MSGEGLSTTATAVIYVDDINDNPPEFTEKEVRSYQSGLVEEESLSCPGNPTGPSLLSWKYRECDQWLLD